jgi:hypothetical protein
MPRESSATKAFSTAISGWSIVCSGCALVHREPDHDGRERCVSEEPWGTAKVRISSDRP